MKYRAVFTNIRTHVDVEEVIAADALVERIKYWLANDGLDGWMLSELKEIDE